MVLNSKYGFYCYNCFVLFILARFILVQTISPKDNSNDDNDDDTEAKEEEKMT